MDGRNRSCERSSDVLLMVGCLLGGGGGDGGGDYDVNDDEIVR